MLQMTNAASAQAIQIAKEKLREFVQETDVGRQAIGLSTREDTDSISLNTLDSRGKNKTLAEDEDDDI